MNQVMVRPQNQVQVTGKEQRLEALEYAKFMFAAGMAPECFKTPEALAVTMLRGAELGFTYSESVTSLYVVKNAVQPYTKTLVYMFEQHGGKVEVLEWDADHAKIRLSQRGRAPLVVAFTLAECKQAGWNMEPDGKGGQREKYTWSRMAKIMVLNRTVTNGIRAYSPTSQFVRTFDPNAADVVDEDDLADESIDGAVTELEVCVPFEPEPEPQPEPVQAEAEEPMPDWTHNAAKVGVLKDWIVFHGMTNTEALKAANIDKLSDFKGSYEEFIAILTDYTTAQASLL